MLESLATLVTGRPSSLFLPDFQARQIEITESIRGSRVLVIGGAGSIGASTIRQLLPFRPRAVHVVDHNENGLAELVRDLRSQPEGLILEDFQALPLDFGSRIMQRFLFEQKPYEIVLHFAALKHVRTEKDVHSLLQMFETNVGKLARLLQWLQERTGTRLFFSVSTDKAANPVNLMGASKRLMEHVLFASEFASGGIAHRSSARFANVAFSNGSLLQSFLARLEKQQPLAVPQATRRYFVSIEEAGQICLLAAFCAPEQHLLIPKLNERDHLRDLEAIARIVLGYYGYEAQLYDDESEARSNVAVDISRGRYPLLLTPLDTTGEKPFEEFSGVGESIVDLGFQHLLGIPYIAIASRAILEFVERLERISLRDNAVAKRDIVDWVCAVLPEFHHTETGRDLDHRM